MAQNQEDKLLALKDQGNDLFKQKKYTEAIEKYQQAVGILPSSPSPDASIFLSNIAACYVNLKKWDECIDVCTRALEGIPSMTKALFRRSTAYENISKFDEALKDLRLILKIEPTNKDAAVSLQRVYKKLEEQSAMSGIRGIIANVSKGGEEMDKAIDVLLVATRDPEQSSEFMKLRGLDALLPILKQKESDKYIRTDVQKKALQILRQLSYHEGKTFAFQIMIQASPQFIAELASIQKEDAQTVKIALYIISKATLTHESVVRASKNRNDHNLTPEEANYHTLVLCAYLSVLTHPSAPKEVLDYALSGLISFPWRYEEAREQVEEAGIVEMLTTLACTSDYRSNFSIISLALSKILDITISKRSFKDFQTKFSRTISSKLIGEDIEKHIDGLTILLCILMANTELGIALLSDHVHNVLLNLQTFPKADFKLQQHLLLLSAELFATACDQDDFRNMKSEVLPMSEMQDMFDLITTAKNKAIKARALVSMAKLASGNEEVKTYLLQDEAEKAVKLAMELLESDESADEQLYLMGNQRTLRQWAIEAISFLTEHPSLKEKFLTFPRFLTLVLSSSKPQEKSDIKKIDENELSSDLQDKKRRMTNICDFSVTNIILHLIFSPGNTFTQGDKDIEDQMIKLKRFAGQNAKPKIHPLDSKEHCEARCDKVVEAGGIKVLVHIARDISSMTQSFAEILAFSFLEIAWLPKHRGLLIAEGALKVLLVLSEGKNPKSALTASQAIAKICITTNPHIAFKAGMEFNIIRPLLNLSRAIDNPLQVLEALMALTNLADLNEAVRDAIVATHKDLAWLESLQLEEDTQIRRAACELCCNLLYCNNCYKVYADPEMSERRVKIWFLFCQEEDYKTQRACAGAVAILSDWGEEICNQINKQSTTLDVYTEFIFSSQPEEMQHRGVNIISNLTKYKEIAERISKCENLTNSLLSLVANSKNPDIVKAAQESLLNLKKFNVLDLSS